MEMHKHMLDLSGLSEQERNAVIVLVMGLLDKHMLVEIRNRAAEKQRSSSESGWLIEIGQLCVGTSSCGFFSTVAFTDPAALRFARKEDAERCAKVLQGAFGWGEFSVNEHSWG